MSAVALAETELIRRLTTADIFQRGVVLAEPMIGKNGEILGERLKAHPALRALPRLDEQLGHTAEQLLLTRKSNTERLRQAVVAERLEQRRARLAAYVQRGTRFLPPASSETRSSEGEAPEGTDLREPGPTPAG